MVTSIKLIADGGGTKPPAKLLPSQVQGAKLKLDAFQKELLAINLKISECGRVLLARPYLGDRYQLSWIKTPFGTPQALTKVEVGTVKSNLIQRRGIVRAQIDAIQGSINGSGAATGGSTTKTPAVTSTTTKADASKKAKSPFSKGIVYNAPAVKEAYFYSGTSFFNEADPEWHGRGATDKFDSSIWSGNTPVKVNSAIDLWTKGQSGKGIIQTWTPPGGTSGFIKDGNWSTLSTGASIQRYGFQFLYNPTTISMSYGGVLDVDPSLQSSGKEEFLASNPTVFQSTIGIEVIINRMYDMKYLAANGLKSGQASDYYSGNVPNKKTLQAIYEKGTMYDVEFLLQTMFPYEPLKSQLRGKTSDVGYLGAMPVELHLGNKLRYVAQINGINVNHVIFDNRMVPIFTTISISTNRIPDYQGVFNDSGSSASVSANGLIPSNYGAGAGLTTDQRKLLK
jgi:hypothetical protein